LVKGNDFEFRKIIFSKDIQVEIYLPLAIILFKKKTKIMAKSKDSKKALKKEPTKTLKEKRAEKKAKKKNA
jgi:hypothetical protein